MSCQKCGGTGLARTGVVSITCEDCDCPDVDQINPPHYQKANGDIDDYICDIVRDLPGIEAYRVSQVIKYLSRYRHKHDNPRTDIEKAKWHLNRLRNLLFAKEVASSE